MLINRPDPLVPIGMVISETAGPIMVMLWRPFEYRNFNSLLNILFVLDFVIENLAYFRGKNPLST